MKLTRIEVKSYRSLYSEPDDQHGFVLELADGMNALIGPNNVGKSNLLRAVALALDPGFPFDRAADFPRSMPWAFPRITLTFQCDRRSAMEATLLRYLEDYERQLVPEGKPTHAQDGTARFTVTFRGGERAGVARQEWFDIRGVGARRGDVASVAKPLAQFRKVLQFVLVPSGQSLEGFLTGRFREILQTVIQDRERGKLQIAERRRSGYVEHLQQDLLRPLTSSVSDALHDLFPEISEVTLVPPVSTLDETLSNVAVRVTDAVETALAAKGTGVRGAVMVAMLHYLADHTKRSIVFAVEEPESFLHPKAQEELRDDLERLAERPDVTLLVTTHSPFIVSRDPKAKVISLTKDAEGRTIVVGEASGAEPHASLLGGLFRDTALPDLLERAARIPPDAGGVLVVEGETDEHYLRLAASAARRLDLLDGLHIQPARGAESAIVQAVLTKLQTDRPVLALFDADDSGLEAAKTLKGRLKSAGVKVLTYDAAPTAPPRAEAEDLFPAALLQRFVEQEGEDAVLHSKQRRKDGSWHYDLRPDSKPLFVKFLERDLRPEDAKRWIDLLILIRDRLAC
jgi:5S rRNA maturation endonuclease (ribonuclease M5)/energy-coupling factor transporter ATP-binding protein EcfA2